MTAENKTGLTEAQYSEDFNKVSVLAQEMDDALKESFNGPAILGFFTGVDDMIKSDPARAIAFYQRLAADADTTELALRCLTGLTGAEEMMKEDMAGFMNVLHAFGDGSENQMEILDKVIRDIALSEAKELAPELQRMISLCEVPDLQAAVLGNCRPDLLKQMDMAELDFMDKEYVSGMMKYLASVTSERSIYRCIWPELHKLRETLKDQRRPIYPRPTTA